MHNDKTIFTIGHSDLPMVRFVELLHSNGVTAIADVRSMPYSRFNPQFNREEIKTALKTGKVDYVYLGDELGARRSEPECYVDGKARYDLIAKTPLFQEGLNRLKDGSSRFRIALMCVERDPITCHRTILVCRHLKEQGFTATHILDNGSTETTEALEQRLLKMIDLEGGDLLSSEKEALEHAYDLQGEKIAYVKQTARTA